MMTHHHVVAELSGTSFVPQSNQQLFYDEAASCIHVVEGRMVTAVPLPTGGGPCDLQPPASVLGTPTKLTPSITPKATPTPASSVDASARGHGEGTRSTSSSESDDDDESNDDEEEEGFSFLASEGPAITGVKAMPGRGAATALQRSADSIEIVDHVTGNMFVASPSTKGVALLGFLWSSCPGADFVLITSQGLELYSMHPGRQGLTLTATHRALDVKLWVWSPGTCLLLCGCGSSGNKVKMWQLVSPCINPLPLLDLSPPWGSPVKAQHMAMTPPPSLSLAAGTAGTEGGERQLGESPGVSTPNASDPQQPGTPTVARPGAPPGHVWVVQLYRRAYVCHYDKHAMVLRLHRVFRNATQLQHELPLYAAKLQLSVVDNVLLVHAVSAAGLSTTSLTATPQLGTPVTSPPPPPSVAILVDISGSGNIANPIVPPAPMAVCDVDQSDEGQGLDVESPGLVTPRGGAQGGSGLANAPASHAGLLQELMLCFPYWAVHPTSGRVLQLKLDLEAIADSWQLSERPDKLLAFLQQRKRGAGGARDPRQVMIHALQRLLQQRATPAVMRAVFDVVNGGCLSAMEVAKRGAVQLEDITFIAPDDLVAQVLQPAVDNGDAELLYFQAICAEYCRSCQAAGLAFTPAAAILYSDTIIQSGQQHRLGPLYKSHAPFLDSTPLADHLETLYTTGCLSTGFDLALSMHSRLGDYPRVCMSLLRCGRVLEALRVLKRHQVETIMPSDCMAAAAVTGDLALFAAAYRMCQSSVNPPMPTFVEILDTYAHQFDASAVEIMKSCA